MRSDEWAAAYSMVITEARVHVADVHDRMAFVLQRDDWGKWVGGSPAEARALYNPIQKP